MPWSRSIRDRQNSSPQSNRAEETAGSDQAEANGPSGIREQMDRIYRIKQGRADDTRSNVMGSCTGSRVRSSATTTSGEAVPAGSHRFLAPVMPSIVVCIGLNYKDHAAEMNKKLPAEPLVFLKPQSSVIGPEDEIRIPSWAGRIEHEAEMAVVIGKRASNVKAADAMCYVLGITCLNDVTARELQAKDVQYSRAKGFDTFCADRPVHRRRSRSVGARRRRLGQRRAPSPLQHARADFPGAVSRRARLALHDAAIRVT